MTATMAAVTFTQTGEDIASLPVSSQPPTDKELEIADVLFPKQISVMDKVYKSARDAVVVGIFFVVLSLPQVDDLLSKFLPVSGSWIMRLVLKMLIMILLYFMYTRLFLVRRAS
jgi:sterol desaturase/sphingolipid hydroxylase (fatty acid hydroxylase superfamily)